MNQDEDEDAFLYGDVPLGTTAQVSALPVGAQPKIVDHDMEQASEGEVEDEEAEEDDDDSVRHSAPLIL